MSKNNHRTGVRNADIVRSELTELHDTQMLSWREIADLPRYRPIPPGTLNSIYLGYPIPYKWYSKLGLHRPVKTEPCPTCGEVHKKKRCKYDRKPWSKRPLREQPTELLRWRIENREDF